MGEGCHASHQPSDASTPVEHGRGRVFMSRSSMGKRIDSQKPFPSHVPCCAEFHGSASNCVNCVWRSSIIIAPHPARLRTYPLGRRLSCQIYYLYDKQFRHAESTWICALCTKLSLSKQSTEGNNNNIFKINLSTSHLTKNTQKHLHFKTYHRQSQLQYRQSRCINSNRDTGSLFLQWKSTANLQYHLHYTEYYSQTF